MTLRILYRKLTSYQLLLLLVAIILAIGVTFYHFHEGFSWLNAYYFSIVTLSTVGYGDITPKTDLGKIFTTFYILIGVGIIGLFINAVVRRAQTRSEKYLKKSK